MAWNEIPAREDENLHFQAYYARLNILYGLLGETSRFVFDQIWKSAEESPMKQFKKSALVGLMTGDLIQALGLTEVTKIEPSMGNWFTHSGATRYREINSHTREAEIKLPSRTIKGIVRTDCYLTSTADANMRDQDEISLVVGRLISPLKFDLIVAGYREPPSTAARIRNVAPPRQKWAGATDLTSLSKGDAWSSKLLELSITGAPDEYLLATAVLDTLSRFQSSIEEQGAWRLLYDDSGHAMHERQHQGMFRIFSRLTFGSLGIQLDPNTDRGSGPTDFTVGLNGLTAILEFKKDDKLAELRHGISIQLPVYMRSASAVYGFYVVMCHTRDPEEVKNYLTGIQEAEPELEFITCVIVDCRKRSSASKAATRSAILDDSPGSAN
ncbi:hypothetical protein [Streptomyces prunicolor]